MELDWQRFLDQWSRMVLSAPGMRQTLPEEGTAGGSLGSPGVEEQRIQEVERRLMRRLPPSYRAFLMASNGWHTGADSGWIFSLEEIDWFAARFPDVLDAWILGSSMVGQPEPVHEHLYRVYGQAQDTSLVRNEDLRACLCVGVGDDGYYLLNPHVITPAGEWEAWFFAPWLPGAERYRSFWDLMQAEFQKVREIVDEKKMRARRSGDPYFGLRTLLDLINREIDERSRMADGAFGIDRQYWLGIIEGIEFARQQVSQIQEQPADAAAIRRALEALASELEQRWRQGVQAARTSSMLDPLELMRLSALAEGSRQAMGMVRDYLD